MGHPRLQTALASVVLPKPPAPPPSSTDGDRTPLLARFVEQQVEERLEPPLDRHEVLGHVLSHEGHARRFGGPVQIAEEQLPLLLDRKIGSCFAFVQRRRESKSTKVAPSEFVRHYAMHRG